MIRDWDLGPGNRELLTEEGFPVNGGRNGPELRNRRNSRKSACEPLWALEILTADDAGFTDGKGFLIVDWGDGQNNRFDSAPV